MSGYEEMYDEFLNEIYPTVVFGDLRFDPATVLRRVDPIAYQVGLSDYIDMHAETFGEMR